MAQTTSGKRAGTRPPRTGARRLLGLAAAATVLVLAWAYLVYAAVDFGSTARGGESRAWWFLAVAAIGAVACLFVGLMLLARLLRELGLGRRTSPSGGKRAAR